MEQSYTAAGKTQLETTDRLKTRANVVYGWKTKLEHAIAIITEEIGLLEAARRRVKQTLSVLTVPMSIAGEFLQLRSLRLEPDLVRDDVEEQLVKVESRLINQNNDYSLLSLSPVVRVVVFQELALCSEIRDLLNRTREQIEMQIAELKNAKTRMESDWSDKLHTYKIDSVCVNLSNDSPLILWKAGATRFPAE